MHKMMCKNKDGFYVDIISVKIPLFLLLLYKKNGIEIMI